jgi:type II secretion system protein H
MSHPRRDSGFTLIEVMLTTALLGLMMTISIAGWSSWAKASEQSGTARELQSLLRQTQQRAVTEGRAMCVQFDVAANHYTVYRGACDDASRVKVAGPVTSNTPDVHIDSPAFTAPAGSNTGVTFNARGTAWPGTVRVTRGLSSKVYTLHVEGLTGRVSIS